jgi:hypothetical protein
MVSEGQPERRMQARSPVHTSSSMPKRVRTTRSPAASCCDSGPLAARALEHALAVGDDDLEALLFGGHGAAQGVGDVATW